MWRNVKARERNEGENHHHNDTLTMDKTIFISTNIANEQTAEEKMHFICLSEWNIIFGKKILLSIFVYFQSHSTYQYEGKYLFQFDGGLE